MPRTNNIDNSDGIEFDQVRSINFRHLLRRNNNTDEINTVSGVEIVID